MTYILSVLILVPLIGAVIAWVAGTSLRLTKVVALAFSLVETALATFLLLGFINPGWGVLFGAPTATPPPTAGAYVPLYYMERYSGWSQFGFNYIVGVDGLSVPLIWLTTLLTTLAIVFHWDQEDRSRAFFGLFLFLEMTLVGVFMALDLLLFAVFWELVIIPMFFLIGIWGGPNRRYAALKFLIFTQVGFVIMLLSIFALYFNSAGVNAAVYGTNANTLDMTAFLHAALRHQTGALATYVTVGLQIPMFAAFLVGFLVKLPSFPFHTWLPDAHVEAPTGGSVLLAGVLLKMGGYGIFRINFGILPDAARNLWWVLAILGTVSMVYAAFVCLAQVDLKRLIAYSSIGHMGFVLLGASSLTVIGVQGGIFQMFNHGIITAILFMLAGSVKHATGTRDIPELQGLAKVMPQFSLILAIGFFASLGLPGLNSFWSEFMVFVGAYGSPNLGEMRRLIIIPLISIVVTAAYYVYTMQRILFGDVPEKLGHSHDLLPWERVSYVVLVALVFGLSTVLLMGFLWTNVISLPTITTAGNHTYFAVEKTPWVPSLNINYILGVDELSVVLVFLNALLTPLALAISWDEHHRVPAFFAMFLFMETTINGVFLSLDLFQFFVFWEVGLIPMYFLIAVWGGPRKKQAAFKFFMYTFLASLPLLLAIFAFYFYSNPNTPCTALGSSLPPCPFDMRAIIATTPIPAGTVVCLAQDDLKRMVAFSSVSHMGFVTLGIAAGVYGFTISGRGAVLGLTGAIFQMFAHGLVSAALFMVAGSLGHKIGTRNISELGGIAKRAPRMATFMMISFMASLGLPGLVGFVAEFSVFIGVYAAFGLLVFVPILTVVVTAAYYIWAMQRAIFGPPNPKWETMPDLHRFEVVPLAVLVASFAVFGIVPVLFLTFLSSWAQGILGGL